MRSDSGILGLFHEPSQAVEAILGVKKQGYKDVRAAMPAPFPEVIKAIGKPRSYLGKVTMLAALIGTIAGFGIATWTSLDWPIITGGKPIVSVPPFVIVAFELSVLVGAVVNLATLIFGSIRGHYKQGLPADIRYSGDSIGVFVVTEDAKSAEAIFNQKGAHEVRHVR